MRFYGYPTTGKTTTFNTLQNIGIPCIDGDDVLSSMVTNKYGVPWNSFWVWWRYIQQYNSRLADVIKAEYHDRMLQLEKLGFILFDNMGLFEDYSLAFIRQSADDVQYYVNLRAEKEGKKPIKWSFPVTSSVPNLIVLAKDEFMEDRVIEFVKNHWPYKI